MKNQTRTLKFLPIEQVSPEKRLDLGIVESLVNPGYFLLTPELAARLEGQPKDAPFTLLLIDFRTLCYPIALGVQKWVSQHENTGRNLPIDQYTALYLTWLNVLTTIAPEVSHFAAKQQKVDDPLFKVVVCDDYPSDHPNFDKPIYWRHHIVPEYKAGRPSKPDNWGDVTKSGFEAAERLGLPICKEEYFEADDIIAQFVRRRAKNNCQSTVIWTVDTDLLQLVSDMLPVVWYNSPYAPYFRDVEIAKAYWLKRWKRIIHHPSHIAEDKAEHGDKSDNLLPGSPIGMIDLLSPTMAPTIDFSSALSYPTQLLSQWQTLHQQTNVELMLLGLNVSNN